MFDHVGPTYDRGLYYILRWVLCVINTEFYLTDGNLSTFSLECTHTLAAASQATWRSPIILGIQYSSLAIRPLPPDIFSKMQHIFFTLLAE